PCRIDIAADGEAALDIKPELIAAMKRLVKEAGDLFGAWHYKDYHFLLSLSDHVAHFGLEHHESNDSRIEERSLIDDDQRKISIGFISHEFVHSWNGKYRRPSGLITENYQQPMKGELLWVYEGLTQYLGVILAARSGLWSGAEYRENLATIAAELDNRPGRM